MAMALGPAVGLRVVQQLRESRQSHHSPNDAQSSSPSGGVQSCTTGAHMHCGWGIGRSFGAVFLITTPLDLTSLLNLVGNPLGIIDAEVDQLLNLVGGLNQASTPYPA